MDRCEPHFPGKSSCGGSLQRVHRRAADKLRRGQEELGGRGAVFSHVLTSVVAGRGPPAVVGAASSLSVLARDQHAVP